MDKVLLVKGVEVKFDLERDNFIDIVGDKDLTDALVRYNSSLNRVTADERASDVYAIFAGAHECICCGRYGFLAPSGANSLDRCGLIDMMLSYHIPKEHVADYIGKRIEMYETLIRLGLNPAMNERFKRAIEILKRRENG